MITGVIDYALHGFHFAEFQVFTCYISYLLIGFISNFPIEQASPSSDGADDFEDETLITSESLSHKIGGGSQRLGPARCDVLGSMKIVLLKSKLNVLIPCGFLAILVNYATQNSVIFIGNSSIQPFIIHLFCLLEVLY